MARKQVIKMPLKELHLKYFILDFIEKQIKLKYIKKQIKIIQDKLIKIVKEYGKDNKLEYNGTLLKIHGKQPQKSHTSDDGKFIDLDGGTEDESCKNTKKREQYLVMYKIEYLHVNIFKLINTITPENKEHVLSSLSFDYLNDNMDVQYRDVVEQEDVAQDFQHMDLQKYKTFSGGAPGSKGDTGNFKENQYLSDTSLSPIVHIPYQLQSMYDNGYVKRKIPPDGHCMFHCIAVHLGSDIFTVRNQVAEWIVKSIREGTLQNWWYVTYLLELSDADKPLKNLPKSTEELIEMIRSGKSNDIDDTTGAHVILWGGQLELMAISSMFKLSVFVFDESTNVTIKIGNYADIVYLLYNGTHYDLLHKPGDSTGDGAISSSASPPAPSPVPSPDKEVLPSIDLEKPDTEKVPIVDEKIEFKTCQIVSFQTEDTEHKNDLWDMFSKNKFHVELDYLQVPFENVEHTIKCLYEKYVELLQKGDIQGWDQLMLHKTMSCTINGLNSFEGIIPDRFSKNTNQKKTGASETQPKAVTVLQTRTLSEINSLIKESNASICVVYNPTDTDYFYMIFCQTYDRNVNSKVVIQQISYKQNEYQCAICEKKIVENVDEYVTCMKCESTDKIKAHVSCVKTSEEQFTCQYCQWNGERVSCLFHRKKSTEKPNTGCIVDKKLGTFFENKQEQEWMWCDGTVQSFDADSKFILGSRHTVKYDDGEVQNENLIVKCRKNRAGQVLKPRESADVLAKFIEKGSEFPHLILEKDSTYLQTGGIANNKKITKKSMINEKIKTKSPRMKQCNQKVKKKSPKRVHLPYTSVYLSPTIKKNVKIYRFSSKPPVKLSPRLPLKPYSKLASKLSPRRSTKPFSKLSPKQARWDGMYTWLNM